ncbi:50S ribosomal protein L9 [bacterium CG2_30_54_10]|nr:MAG: 50S ribosomal protein L9 [bacterium CG2_30_54_10]
MQILLIKDIDHVGKKGDSRKVTEGYARNFLFPRSLAVPFTPGSQRNLKLVEVSWKRKELKEKEAVKLMAEKIEGLSIRITKKAGDKGRLFGSVTSAEIADAILAASRITIDKKDLVVDHIKELGQHDVVVRFSGEVKATIKVVVLPDVETPASV